MYQWQLMLDDKVIKKKVRMEIQEYVHGRLLKEHWIEKGRFTRDTIESLDWTALRQAVKRKPLHHQRWATKFISGFCGSYYKLHQIGKHDTPLCPRCGLFEETTEHILFCSHIKSQENRTEALKTLDRWLETRWDVRETIVTTLTLLQPTSMLFPNVPHDPYDDDILEVARRQDSIGTQNFLEGFICSGWRNIMQHYYREIGSQRTALSWAAGLHYQLQLFTRSQWDHRNLVVHARNAKGRKITSEQEIQSRLEYQLELGMRYLPTHLHQVMNYTIPEALQQPRSKMLSWLHHLETVRPFYEATESREVNTQRIFLRHWLRT